MSRQRFASRPHPYSEAGAAAASTRIAATLQPIRRLRYGMLTEVNLGRLFERCSKVSVLLLPAFLASCFEPEIPACLRCPSGQCTSGQSCVEGYCAEKGQRCGAVAEAE